jgi:serine/threonine protein kinase
LYFFEKVAIKTVDKRNFKNEDQKIHALNEKSISHDFSMRLHHKNIVEVYEVITDDDFIYIIMEYLAGGELFDKIKERGRLEENLAKTWFKEIVEAVKYIHDVSTDVMIKYNSFQNMLIRHIS